VVHHPAQVGVRPGGGHLGRRRLHLRQVDALLGGLSLPLGSHDRGDHGNLLGGDLTLGEGGGDRGQLLHHPPLPHNGSRRGRGQPGVTPQPRPHGRQSVVLRRLSQLGDPDGAGQLGVHPVAGADQHRGAVELLSGGHGVQIVGGQGVERRLQLAHDTSHTFDRVFEAYRWPVTVSDQKRRSERG
jgi:hypothetical protein